MGKIGRFLSDFTYFFQTLKWVVFRKYQVSEPLIGSSCYILWVFQTLLEIFENFHFLGDFWGPKGQKMQFFAIFRNFSAPQWPEITEKWKFKKIPNNVWNIYEMQQHDQLWGSEGQQHTRAPVLSIAAFLSHLNLYVIRYTSSGTAKEYEWYQVLFKSCVPSFCLVYF